YAQEDYATARSLREESLAILRKFGGKWMIAASLGDLGGAAYMQGDYAAARSLYEESLAIRWGEGDMGGTIAALTGLGPLALAQGQVEQGTRLMGAAEALSE